MSESIICLKNKIHQLSHENHELKEREKKYKLKILNLKYKLEKLQLKYDINVNNKSDESDASDYDEHEMKRSESKLNELFTYLITKNQTMTPQETSFATNETKAIANQTTAQSSVINEEEPIVQHKTNNNNNNNNKKTTNPTEDNMTWKDECLELIDAILANPDSVPFREPINLKDYPNYKTIVKEPMDFGTIREKLLNGQYKTINEFDYDCNLVFINSELFFTNKKSKVYAMTLRLADFYDQNVEFISNNHQQKLKIQPFAMPTKPGGNILNDLLNLTATVDQKRVDSPEINNQAFKTPEFFFYRPKNRKNNNQSKAEHEVEVQMESTRDESGENEKPIKQDSKKEIQQQTNSTQKRNRKHYSYKETSSPSSDTEEDSKKQTNKQIITPRTHKKQRKSDAHFSRHSNNNESD